MKNLDNHINIISNILSNSIVLSLHKPCLIFPYILTNYRDQKTAGPQQAVGKINSQLRQWPIQLYLISPMAPYYQSADVLLTADCVAYALDDFHREYLKDKSLAIACPKLDSGKDIYQEKLRHRSMTPRLIPSPC